MRPPAAVVVCKGEPINLAAVKNGTLVILLLTVFAVVSNDDMGIGPFVVCTDNDGCGCVCAIGFLFVLPLPVKSLVSLHGVAVAVGGVALVVVVVAVCVGG